MKLRIYHGTGKEAAENIQKDGFRKNYGRWGTGAYFAGNFEYAQGFGQHIITVLVDDAKLFIMNYKDIAKVYNLDEEEEEGFPQIETYVLQKGYDGILIKYAENDVEVCIYNTHNILIERIGTLDILSKDPIEQLNALSHLLPTPVLEDIHKRIGDWLASGGEVTDPYIEQQLRFAKRVLQLKQVS